VGRGGLCGVGVFLWVVLFFCNVWGLGGGGGLGGNRALAAPGHSGRQVKRSREVEGKAGVGGKGEPFVK